MTYDEAVDEIVKAVLNLKEEDQIPFIENQFAQEVHIFPTKDFNKFCEKLFKKKQENQYLAFTEIIQESINNWCFDIDDPWIIYYEDNEAFESACTLGSFIDNAENLAQTVVDDYDLETDLNIPAQKAEEIYKTICQ